MSDNYSPSTRLNIRAELCRAHGLNSKFDIGINPGAACSRPEVKNSPMCRDCQLCFGRGVETKDEQIKYRYHIIVDGIGASYDASIWKLLSNSAVIRLRPNGWEVPMLELFFEPLLEPYVHIIPSDVAGLPSAVQWCESNPGRCERLAKAGQNFIRCLLRKEVLDAYILGVFDYMHDSLKYPTHTSAEYSYAIHQ